MDVVWSAQCVFGFPQRVVATASDFHIPQNTFNLLLGGNGAGKSTILSTLATEIELMSGALSFSKDESVSASQRIGYVPQRVIIPQYLPITVREYILLGASRLTGIWNSFSKEVEDHASSLIHDLGLYEIESEVLSHLSVGQLQRATIARELIGQPRLLLLDETTSGIDVKNQSSVMSVIQNIKNHCSVLLATHDLHHISLPVDWVYVIEDEVLTKKSFEESRCC
jgi:zinc transport system ATP-binding protein